MRDVSSSKETKLILWSYFTLVIATRNLSNKPLELMFFCRAFEQAINAFKETVKAYCSLGFPWDLKRETQLAFIVSYTLRLTTF